MIFWSWWLVGSRWFNFKAYRLRGAHVPTLDHSSLIHSIFLNLDRLFLKGLQFYLRPKSELHWRRVAAPAFPQIGHSEYVFSPISTTTCGIPMKTYFLLLLSSITHLMPSIVQLEHVTSPSAVIWYFCVTSHRTFRARQAAQAFAALLLTGFGLPSLSSPADVEGRFLFPESTDSGECDEHGLLGSREGPFSALMMDGMLSEWRSCIQYTSLCYD